MILLALEGGASITMEVELSDTVDYLKEKIEEMMEVPPDQQVLKFNGQVLEDGHTLSDYNIERFGTVKFELAPDSLTLSFNTLTCGTITLHCKATYKIEDIRAKLQDITEHQSSDQRLFLTTSQTERILLQDGNTLGDYEIDEDSELFYIWNPRA